MAEQIIKDLTFVQVKGQGIDGFGYVLENHCKKNLSYLATTEMDEDFGVSVAFYSEIEVLDEEMIQRNLDEIRKNPDSFKHFVIQLNDIKEMSKYHIPETEGIKSERETNEVCQYWSKK